MGTINSHTITAVKTFVYDMLERQLPKNYVFHSKAHTVDVLKNVEIIGKYEGLKEDELNILRASALFHDIGYTKTYKGHEDESVTIASDFLRKEQISTSIIDKITTAILATKTPQNPKDKLSGILCDADLMHLTYDNYFDNSELLRKEWESAGIAKMSKKEFHLNSLNFIQSHVYHSVYGRQILEKKKEITLKRIKAEIT